jgi:hypothetical protein
LLSLGQFQYESCRRRHLLNVCALSEELAASEMRNRISRLSDRLFFV